MGRLVGRAASNKGVGKLEKNRKEVSLVTVSNCIGRWCDCCFERDSNQVITAEFFTVWSGLVWSLELELELDAFSHR